MKTISKNARLSVTALVFGAALMTGVNAFGMEQEISKQEIEQAKSRLAIIDACLNNSQTRTDFHKCLDVANGKSFNPSKKEPVSEEMQTILDVTSQCFSWAKKNNSDASLCYAISSSAMKYFDRLKDPAFTADERKADSSHTSEPLVLYKD